MKLRRRTVLRLRLPRWQVLALERAGGGGRLCCLTTGETCHRFEDGQPCLWLHGDIQLVLAQRFDELRERSASPRGHLSRYPDRRYKRRPGINARHDIDEFIEDLYEVYHAEGGLGRKVSYDPYEDRCYGAFLEFVKVALRICDVGLTDMALRKRINKAIDGRLLWD